MKDYEPKDIEAKWQKVWEQEKAFKAADNSKKPKFYALTEFPYPSGEGLHTGHVRSYTAMDIISRKRRMEGYDVLYPIGWDAFGLPAENYAIKTGIQPAITTQKNIENYRKQLKSLGILFDWSREVDTTDPKYYHWTQWLFLKFLEHGLAYKSKQFINWCPKDKIGLANEEVVNGCCERCGTPVEQREKEQWMLAITKYADRLDKDLDDVDFPERVKVQQRNWIGKKEGAVIKFDDIEIFTTRPETIFGATFIAIAGAVDKFTGRTVTNPATKEQIPVWEAEYVMSDVGTGAVMGVPAHDERDFEFAKKHDLPIKRVVEARVLAHTNLASAVIRTDKGTYLFQERDGNAQIAPNKISFFGGHIDSGEDPKKAVLRELEEELELKVSPENIYLIGTDILTDGKIKARFFVDGIKKEDLVLHEGKAIIELGDIDELIQHPDVNPSIVDFLKATKHLFEGAFTQDGILVNSKHFNGLDSEKTKDKIVEFVKGEKKTTFKLRDWIFSRQRYWGEPIPVIHCEKCGIVPVPEKDLPIVLPEVEKYEPTDNGESPLANISDWVNVKCPKCGGDAKRETDTMPNWAGSSWYFLRYTDPHNDEVFASKDKLKHWMPVDWYNGGMEHTTLHLLYSRFWNKFFFDIGLVPTSEPYKKRTSHGLILAEGGVKMSKSVGNVINPDTIVNQFGADTLRIYEMFMGPFEQAIAWSEESLVGPRRFIEKVWKLKDKVKEDGEHTPLADKTAEKVSGDIEKMKFNTAVSAMMILANEMKKMPSISTCDYETLLKILSPFAPHVAEELWEELGHSNSIQTEPWPTDTP